MAKLFALVMIRMYYSDLTWGEFADRFGIEVHPHDRDFLVGDCEIINELNDESFLHKKESKRAFIGFCHNVWHGKTLSCKIPDETIKHILTFEDTI